MITNVIKQEINKDTRSATIQYSSMCRLQFLLKCTNTFSRFVGSRLLNTTTTPKNELLEHSVLATGRLSLLQQANASKDNLNITSTTLYMRPVSVLNSIGNPQFELPKGSLINEVHFPYVHETNFRLPPARSIQDIGKQKPVIHIEAPTQNGIIEKHAARLIVIRRRKMKKHKLKKLRIKMKYEWAKVRQRREMRKEKLFQAELISQIKEAEKFDAEQYVTQRLKEYHRLMTKH